MERDKPDILKARGGRKHGRASVQELTNPEPEEPLARQYERPTGPNYPPQRRNILPSVSNLSPLTPSLQPHLMQSPGDRMSDTPLALPQSQSLRVSSPNAPPNDPADLRSSFQLLHPVRPSEGIPAAPASEHRATESSLGRLPSIHELERRGLSQGLETPRTGPSVPDRPHPMTLASPHRTIAKEKTPGRPVSTPTARGRKPKVFAEPVPSVHCHICGRSSKSQRVAICANLSSGTCRKVICEYCFEA